jgi:hypothetical protein
VQRYVKEVYDVAIENGFSLREQNLLLESIMDVAGTFGSAEVFRLAMGGSKMRRNSKTGTYTSGMVITFDHGHFNQRSSRMRIGTKIGTVHELAHVWSNKWDDWPEVAYAAFTSSDMEGPTAYGSLDKTMTWALSPVSEHWAESVAMYVYPQYSDVIRNDASMSKDLHQKELGLNDYTGPGLTVNQAAVMRLFFDIFVGERR